MVASRGLRAGGRWDRRGLTAAQIVRQRLSAAEPKNDGKQTPMRGAPHGHPIFLGQHATGTCCRGCLEKWHGIPKGRPLTDAEQTYIVDVLMQWISRQNGTIESKNRVGEQSRR